MGAPAVGTVVLVPFPFSDLSGTKKRPALVLAGAGRGDWVCTQITSNPYGDTAAIELAESDYIDGSLARVSYVRPGKLFTAHEGLFLRAAAQISNAKLMQVRQTVIALIQTGRPPGGMS
ncbi:MAG: MazF family transcriptional regulator [Acidiferrobacteraceae bacterium]